MNSQIYAEASEWLVEFRTGEARLEKRRAFQDWLDASPEHVRAYLELTSIWEDSSGLDRERRLDLESMVAASRAETNVVDLAESDDSGNASSRARRTHAVVNASARRRFAFAASVVLLLGAAIGAWGWSTLRQGTYTTDVGQQQTLALPDGTTVELNADTRIRERYTATWRRVELLRGQALFRVAKDAARPFIVVSNQTTVRAVGTEFDVRRSTERTIVTVLEGRVAIQPPALSRAEPPSRSAPEAGKNYTPGDLLLTAGQQTTVTAHAVAPPTRTNVTIATAWTRQKLIFEATTLADAAEEFNRFNARKLLVNPAGLEDFRINGTFPALDPSSLGRFLAFLRQQPGIAVLETDDSVRIEKNR